MIGSGLARHGVLETMAPLRVPPPSRAKQKARSLGDVLAKGPVLGRKGAAFGEEEASTPELTPANAVVYLWKMFGLIGYYQNGTKSTPLSPSMKRRAKCESGN